MASLLPFPLVGISEKCRKKYVPTQPNVGGRYPILELEMEVGLLEGWARFWFRGELLPTPAEMQRKLADIRKARDDARRERDEANREREAIEREIEQIRSQLAQAKKPPQRP